MHAWILELQGKIRKLISKDRSACKNICLGISLWIVRCHWSWAAKSPVFKELLRLPLRAPNFSKLWKLVHPSRHFDIISQWRSQWGGGGRRPSAPGEMFGPFWENSDWTSRSGNFILSCFVEIPSRVVANPNGFAISMSFNGSGL